MRVFDGHCDTILRCYQNGGGFAENGGHLDLKRMAPYGHWAQFFACFGEPEDFPGKPLFQVFREEAALFQEQVEANAELVVHCRTAAEAEAAWAAGKQAAFLSVEGAELLDCDLDKLGLAYELGVRAVNITWNHVNALSGTNVESPEKGLTPLGRAFVEKMQALGMLVDVSHLSDPGFWDVMELAQKPVFASHSNSRALCGHSRNLTDGQFSAIINNRGVAGLNMACEFLGPGADVDRLVDHVEHWLDLGGEKNISLGGDWDGISHPPKGVSGIQDLEKLADCLLRRGHSEALIEDIFCNNLMRVVSEVCTTQAPETK